MYMINRSKDPSMKNIFAESPWGCSKFGTTPGGGSPAGRRGDRWIQSRDKETRGEDDQSVRDMYY